MIKHENSINNYGMYYHHLLEMVRLRGELETAEYMHYCKESKEIEKLRDNAVKAVDEYVHAIFSDSYDEAAFLTAELLQKKTIF